MNTTTTRILGLLHFAFSFALFMNIQQHTQKKKPRVFFVIMKKREVILQIQKRLMRFSLELYAAKKKNPDP
jgi:hypothetical protein